VLAAEYSPITPANVRKFAELFTRRALLRAENSDGMVIAKSNAMTPMLTRSSRSVNP
jgi:hypothetical protein